MEDLEGRRVLVIGLDPRRVPGPWDPEPMVQSIEAAMGSLAAHGTDAVSCLVGLDGSDDIEERVAAALRSGTWDCVLVGGGIRHSDDLLEVFETCVNLVHRLAPEAEIAFNRRPDDIVDAVDRRLSTPGQTG